MADHITSKLNPETHLILVGLTSEIRHQHNVNKCRTKLYSVSPLNF